MVTRTLNGYTVEPLIKDTLKIGQPYSINEGFILASTTLYSFSKIVNIREKGTTLRLQVIIYRDVVLFVFF